MPLWATPGDVYEVTGRTVSAEDILPANSVVEALAFATRDPVTAVTDVSAVDRDRLRQAVAHQAWFQTANPSTATLPNAQSVRMGDAAITYRAGGSGSTSINLAPVVAALIDALSWNREVAVAAATGAAARARFPAAPDDTGLWADTQVRRPARA